MNGHDRILALVEGRPVDCLPLMPITMMFAADQLGVPYGRYAEDYRVMVEAQVHVAEKFDLDYVSGISDPAREAADCGATGAILRRPAAGDRREPGAVGRQKTYSPGCRVPDPLGGGRMHDRVRGGGSLSPARGLAKS